MDWIDIQAQMPWLGPPPFWLAHPKGPELRSTLAHLGFAVFEARTNATVTEEQFLRLVAQAMGLSEYASDNWDAFVDGFGNLVRSTTEPIAFIWLDPAEAFVRDLKKGLRLYATLSSILDEWNRWGPECHQVVLFLQGETTFFPSGS